jgi:uncharacterized protein (TIGR02453 family)
MQAAPSGISHFNGFSPGAFELLRELALNNNRSWFDAHRPALEELLVRPSLALIEDLGAMLRRRVSPGLRAEPQVGGSLLRLRRDARFARAAPFRAHLELWFWEGGGSSSQHPGCCLRLTPDRLVLGGGITTFRSDMLRRYRSAVDEPGSGRELAALLHRLTRRGWSVDGPALRRVPRPYGADHARPDLLRRLGLKVERPEPMPEAVFNAELPALVASGLAQLAPLHHWLTQFG